MFRHWEYLIVAEREEREGVGSSGKEGNGAETAGRKIRDQYDRKQWTEEGHQRLTVKAAFLCQKWGGRVHGPRMAPVGVRFSYGAV